MPEDPTPFTYIDPDGDALAIHPLGAPLTVALIINDDAGVTIRKEDVERVIAAIRAAAGVGPPEGAA